MADSRVSSMMFWFRCLLAAILTWGMAILILMFAMLALTLVVGYENGETVEFIERIGETWFFIASLMIFAAVTTVAAWWATRGRRLAILGGLMVGILAGLVRFIERWPPGTLDVTFLGTVAIAGWIGGRLGNRREKAPSSG